MVYGGGVFTVQIQEIYRDLSLTGLDRFGRIRYYTFVGGGLSIGLKGGATFASDWKEFGVPVLATVDDFEGIGGITALPSIALLLASLNLGIFLEFKNPSPVSIYLNTSGLGLASGVGATAISKYGGWWERRD